MPEPDYITSNQIVEAVGRAIGRQRKELDQQLQSLRDSTSILINRLLRSAEQGLETFHDQCMEDGETADQYCQSRFAEPLTEAYGEYYFARSLSTDTAILRSDGKPLLLGKGTKDEHLRILLLRAVERICGRTVPRGFHDVETANASFLRCKSERLYSLAAGLAGDPRGDVRTLNLFYMLEDAKSLGATHAMLRPLEVKLERLKDALSAAADEWAITVSTYGYQPHHSALKAHKTRNDLWLPPAHKGNVIAVACQDCATRFQKGQPFQLRILRENDDER